MYIVRCTTGLEFQPGARAADAAAESAQIKMIAELGNPFRKEHSNEDH